MFELWLHEPVAHYLVDMVLKDVPDAHNPRYSSTLTDLIKLCLMKELGERPSLEELELKIGTKCQSISTEFAANPSLIEHERLYHKGSEINQMPPGEGNGNYWRPIMEVLTNPSAYSGPDFVKNPFTARIIYPPRPGSEKDGPEGAEGEAQKRNDDVESHKGLGNHGARKLETGAGADRPIVLSDDDKEDEVESERGDVSDRDGDVSNSSEDEKDSVERERGDVSDRDGNGSNGSDDEGDGVESERGRGAGADNPIALSDEDEEDGAEGERGDVSDRDGDRSNGSEDGRDEVERERGAGADNPVILSDEEEDGVEGERGDVSDRDEDRSNGSEDEKDGVESEGGDVSDRDGDRSNGSEDDEDRVERERGDVSERFSNGSNGSEDRSSSERKPDDSDENDGSNGSEDSDDSDTRRRAAIKKPVLS